MDSAWEPFAGEGEDACLRSCDLPRDLYEIDTSEASSVFLRLVMPVDAVQVEGVDIPQPYAAELLLDILRDEGGVLHLCECRELYAFLPASCSILLDDCVLFPEVYKHIAS